MKRPHLIVATVCLLFSLTSCGNDAGKPITEQELENMTEKELEDVLLALESAEKEADANNQETSVSMGSSYEAKQEILDAAWDSGLVQIDDKLIQLPIYLQEWVDLGLDYEIDSNKSKDFLFTKGETVSLNLTYNGEQLGRLSFVKETESPETVGDMNPLIDEISTIRKPGNITMYFPGGLTFGDPYANIEEKLGKGAEIDGNMTYVYGQIGGSYSDLHYGISVFVDRDSQTISRFIIGKSIQESDRDKLTLISFENVPNMQTSDTHNVTLLWAPEYKQYPGFVVSERCADTVIDDNGKKYYMSLSFSMLGQQYASPMDYIEYGDPILDTTDENGMNRKVYNAGADYVVVCSTDAHIFKARIRVKDLSDPTQDAQAALQDMVFEFANSVQY